MPGTHFGFWYRMHATPDGPSRSTHPNYCPRKVPQGLWEHNTVHSQGWFGIWIFQVRGTADDVSGFCAANVTNCASEVPYITKLWSSLCI